jgi:hypothetical protein
MKSGGKKMETAEEMIREHEEFNKKREAIRKLNESLIKKWDSIPWWKFWEMPSFEERRDIIISNWDRLNH